MAKVVGVDFNSNLQDQLYQELKAVIDQEKFQGLFCTTVVGAIETLKFDYLTEWRLELDDGK